MKKIRIYYFKFFNIIESFFNNCVLFELRYWWRDFLKRDFSRFLKIILFLDLKNFLVVYIGIVLLLLMLILCCKCNYNLFVLG